MNKLLGLCLCACRIGLQVVMSQRRSVSQGRVEGRHLSLSWMLRYLGSQRMHKGDAIYSGRLSFLMRHPGASLPAAGIHPNSHHAANNPSVGAPNITHHVSSLGHPVNPVSLLNPNGPTSASELARPKGRWLRPHKYNNGIPTVHS